MLSLLITWDSILIPLKRGKTSVSLQESLYFHSFFIFILNQHHSKRSIWYTEGQMWCPQETPPWLTYLKLQKYVFAFFPRQIVQWFSLSPQKHTKKLDLQPSPSLQPTAHRVTLNTTKSSTETAQPMGDKHQRYGSFKPNQAKPVTEEKVMVPAGDPGLLTGAGGPSASSCRTSHFPYRNFKENPW